MSDDYVLDASALLCLLLGEVGAGRVADVLPRSAISAVNLSEVAAKLADSGGRPEQIGMAFNPSTSRWSPSMTCKP